MTIVRRTVTALALSVCVVTLLSSCTPATFAWGYVSRDSHLKVAFCSSSVVTMIRLSVSERPVRTLVEVQSVVWSGPRIQLPEGGILNETSLPRGWQATNELDLEGNWDRIDVALYDGNEYVDFAILENEDISTDAWSLSPQPGLLSGVPQCAAPAEALIRELPADGEPPSADIAQAKAVAMPEDEFWTLISLAHPRTGGSIEELESALQQLPGDEARAFHAQLMLQYYRLDTARVWNESERRRTEDFDYDSDSEASFTELRSVIILEGRDAVAAALSGEDLETSQTWMGPLRLALLAGPTATDSISLSPSMGLNSDGW